ncbi:hypothetical protein LV779_16305 [Streptomyces thinghirensis]|nr:hypothetical protein [Streptomyces thinghirensis]
MPSGPDHQSIFTFINSWNDFHGPADLPQRARQVHRLLGLKMFVDQEG